MPQGIYPRKDALTRFWNFVSINKDSGCWEWIGYCHPEGYGYIRLNKRNTRAARFSYEYFNNTTIPFYKVIDHLCRNRKCVNPEHLELVTVKENTNRGISPLRNLSKTHCPLGHPYDSNNTIYKPNGGRDCKECHRIKNKIAWNKLKTSNNVRDVFLLAFCIKHGISARRQLGVQVKSLKLEDYE